MEKAGMDVLCPPDGSVALKSGRGELLRMSNCSVHLIGKEHDAVLGESASEFDFEQIHVMKQRDMSEFRIFVWQPDSLMHELDTKQQLFVRNIQQNLSENMVFSTQKSPVMFVEDMRTVMYSRKKKNYDAKETDVFLIYNAIDETSGQEIFSILGDIMRVEVLGLDQGANTDYEDLVKEQILKAKVTVIYFDKTADWALPFTKQVWRATGGASSPSHLMWLGDSANSQIKELDFVAPNVSGLILSRDLMPLEIKVMFDKLNSI
jgi:hypothetical protein